MHLEHPPSIRTTTADDYHGRRIADPYRWQEASIIRRYRCPVLSADLVRQGTVSDDGRYVFDDFIAVAERLIADGYTSASCLAIMAGSNGGLLVAVAMQQRPELFAATVPIVGVLDMLRYDLFTGGRAWVTEYGTASDAEQFGFLRASSPLHISSTASAIPRR